MSSYIAAYLEPFGPQRRTLQRRIVKLYDARSKAAHGAGIEATAAFAETYALFRRVLLRIFADGSVPTREQLDDLLFGVRA